MTGAAYTALHKALENVALTIGIAPFDCRVLLALDERGGDATTLELAEDLRCGDSGSAVRRAVGRLYNGHLADGSGVDGKRRRQGVRTLVTLTSRGKQIVANIREQAT